MNQYDTRDFKKDLEAFGIVLSERQLEQFLRYYEMLAEWNDRVNLTAITEYQDVLKKHFVDSLSLTKVYDLRQNYSIVDVGTGAGFPGLALKIAFPGLKVTLLDSLNKRIQFLDAVIKELGLQGVETVHGGGFGKARETEGILRSVRIQGCGQSLYFIGILPSFCKKRRVVHSL